MIVSAIGHVERAGLSDRPGGDRPSRKNRI
jgi:hypothetical protein